MTRDHVLCNFDKCRKAENEDPLHKWIGSYNTRLVALPRFFNGLHYPNIDDPKRRMGLSAIAIGRKSDCIIGIRHLNRKQTSCYKPRDLWSQQDDLPFQK